MCPQHVTLTRLLLGEGYIYFSLWLLYMYNASMHVVHIVCTFGYIYFGCIGIIATACLHWTYYLCYT